MREGDKEVRMNRRRVGWMQTSWLPGRVCSFMCVLLHLHPADASDSDNSRSQSRHHNLSDPGLDLDLDLDHLLDPIDLELPIAAPDSVLLLRG